MHCDSEVENDETSMSPTRTNGKLPFGGATDLRTPADFNAPLGFRYLGICCPATRHAQVLESTLDVEGEREHAFFGTELASDTK